MQPQPDRCAVARHRLSAPRTLRGGRLFVLVLALHGLSDLAWAADPPELTALQELDFGTIAVRDNAGVAAVKVSARGAPAYSGGVVFIAAPTPGHYRVSGLPPFVTLTPRLPATQAALPAQIGGPVLTLTQAVFQPTEPRTNAEGEVEFQLGASMQTSGDGQPYADGVYHAFPALELDFVYEDKLQTARLDLNATINLRSTLELSELEALNFGRLVALGSSSERASYVLQPNGAAHIITPGQTRLLRYGDSSPARIRVSGGAPFASFHIELPSESVLLTHSSRSADVAQFEVDDFSVLPLPGELKLDSSGNLDLRIGATLKTEQSSRRYADGEYLGTYSITVNY